MPALARQPAGANLVRRATLNLRVARRMASLRVLSEHGRRATCPAGATDTGVAAPPLALGRRQALLGLAAVCGALGTRPALAGTAPSELTVHCCTHACCPGRHQQLQPEVARPGAHRSVTCKRVARAMLCPGLQCLWEPLQISAWMPPDEPAPCVPCNPRVGGSLVTPPVACLAFSHNQPATCCFADDSRTSKPDPSACKATTSSCCGLGLIQKGACCAQNPSAQGCPGQKSC